MPQKLSAIEAMALLNLLAVDKTGTLTSDEVTLEQVAAFGDENDYSEADIASFAALVLMKPTAEISLVVQFWRKLRRQKIRRGFWK